jgi:predicted MPP superfamily phosphohydrolase
LHFCAVRSCLFRMATEIGTFAVSTIGDYRPDNSKNAEKVGCDRLFETMVFRVVGRHDCGCPDLDMTELAMTPYDYPQDALDGHMAMCRRVASGEFT